MTTCGLHAGVAAIDITPPVGLDLSGGAFGPSRGVLHPLFARALWLVDGVTSLLLIACDLLGFDEAYASAIREAIAREQGIPTSAIMLTATHTHCGPATVALREWGRQDAAYLAELQRRLVRVAAEARANVQPARAGAGAIACPGIAVNRVDEEYGAVNDSLGLMRVDDAAGDPLALLVHYCCHPVNLHSGGLITPDFPHYLAQRVHEGLGAAVPVLYLSGASGDLNPRNFAKEASEAHAAETGQRLAAAALELFPTVATSAGITLGCASVDVDLPLQALPPREELLALIAERERRLAAESDRTPTNWAYCGHLAQIAWAREALEIQAAGTQQSTRRITLQAFRIGETAFVGVPGEPFAAYGIAVSQAGLFPHAFLVELANGCIGYFPTPEAYARNSYEAVFCPRYLGVYAFHPTVGPTLQQACLSLLGEVARGERVGVEG